MIDNDMPDLYEFDRECHVFRMRGRRVPSVTQVLREAGLVRFYCSRPTLEEARRRGRDVHMLVADMDVHPGRAYDAGNGIEGYGRAWQAFRMEYGFVHDASEQKVFNDIHGYAGIYDKRGWLWAGRSTQREVLLEIKSGGFAPWHAEQLAGYSLAVEPTMEKGPERWAVYLRPDGKFSVKMFGDVRDYGHFLAALTITKLREQRNLIQPDVAFDEIFTGEMMGAEFPGGGS